MIYQSLLLFFSLSIIYLSYAYLYLKFPFNLIKDRVYDEEIKISNERDFLTAPKTVTDQSKTTKYLFIAATTTISILIVVTVIIYYRSTLQ